MSPRSYPFASQPTFAKWFRRTFKRSYERAVDGARKAPAAKVRLDDHVFARSNADVRRLEKATDFVITCAQNNTEPEWNFLHALERYAKERGARLVVIPMRYANPTSKRDPQEEKSEDYWWHEALHEYLVENELRVHQHLRIMGDVRIQASAVHHPLSGLESRSRDASAIYGHPQLAWAAHRRATCDAPPGAKRWQRELRITFALVSHEPSPGRRGRTCPAAQRGGGVARPPRGSRHRGGPCGGRGVRR